jgi:hypothetical protein
MIEAFWRSLRHAWLYLHDLDDTTTLGHLIEFYARAREERRKANRMATCGVCVEGHDFGALQLQRAECGIS